ncbi:MAG TPA: PEP-CTERM sorting domain-containing protein, partial [Casimicrobiaceae bacterium]
LVHLYHRGNRKMKRLESTKLVIGSFGALAFAVALQASANVFTFATPTGSMVPVDGAVNASATVTTGAGTVTISLTDLLANPTSVGELISDFDFVLSGGQTTGTLTSSSGQQITVAGNGTTTLGSTGSTGWGLNSNVAGGLQLDALGFVGPAGLILGPPGAGGVYTNANPSIAGNGPHNPFLNQTATFTVTVAGVTTNSNITSATFSFGTTAGVNVPGVLQLPSGKIPEPASIALLGIGLLAFGASRRNRKA